MAEPRLIRYVLSRELVVRCVCVCVGDGKKNYRHKHQPTIPSIRAMRLHLRLRLYGRAGPDNAGVRKRCSSESERERDARRREREDVGESHKTEASAAPMRDLAQAVRESCKAFDWICYFSSSWQCHGMPFALPAVLCTACTTRCPLVPTSLACLFSPLPLSPPLLQPPFFLLQVAFSRSTAPSDG